MVPSASSTHLSVLVADFFMRSACQWVMSSLQEAARVPVCESRVSVSCYRVGGGGGTHLCPILSLAFPASPAALLCITPPPLTSLLHLPLMLHDVDRRQGCAVVDCGRRQVFDTFGIHVPQKKNNDKSQGNTQNIAPGGQQVINKKCKMRIK
jgi:hypothetical protein